jgi:hypothetical protein
MTKTVFYSWQSDRNEKSNRYFIKTCLEMAAKKLKKELGIEETLRVDHDTKGIPGIPEITKTILDKIDQSTIFVADITIVARTKAGKKIPNSNVLIELGYALKSRTDERIILIMNESYGNWSSLPFNMAYRRKPVTYKLNENPDEEEIKHQQEQLVAELMGAIKLILDKASPISVLGSPSIRVVKGSTDEAYFIEDRVKRYIPDALTHEFIMLDNYTQTERISDLELNSYPKGKDLPKISECRLVKGSEPPQFVIWEGHRKHIPDGPTVEFFFQGRLPEEISDKELEEIPLTGSLRTIRAVFSLFAR